jgi:3-hydroxy-9,10-secoandrosta-1,3,5(10)-triene-9,17-dione monooxygenase
MTTNATHVAFADRRIPEVTSFPTAEKLPSLTSETLAHRMRELTPLLSTHARETELLRRPVDSVWSALLESGFFRQFVPAKFGGMEVTPEAFIDSVLPLAQGCSSTAWCAAFCAVHNWHLAHFPMQTQDEIWGAQPYVIAPDVTFPPGRAVKDGDGFRIKGHWKWASGVMHADWIFAKVLIEIDGKYEMMQTIFPARDASVLDTWHVDGMSGTGSNDVTVDNLFIPPHRIVPVAPVKSGKGLGARYYDNPLYHMPALPLLCIAAAIPAIGTARAAVGHLQQRLIGHITVGTEVAQKERPAAQMRLSRADLLTRTAELILRSVAREGLRLGEIDEPRQTGERIRMRAQLAFAVGLCREAIAIICEAAGSSLHFLNNPLQRAKRDVDVLSSHVVYDSDIANELHGRSLLGMPPNTTLT